VIAVDAKESHDTSSLTAHRGAQRRGYWHIELREDAIDYLRREVRAFVRKPQAQATVIIRTPLHLSTPS
jgi:hypothetical protein